MTITDIYGRVITITDLGNGTTKYVTSGIKVVLPNGRDPLEVFNSMAPE